MSDTTNNNNTDTRIDCSICGNKIDVHPISGWAEGNNAGPVNNGRCCDTCNETVVIPQRIERYSRSSDRGLAARVADHNEVYRATGDRRAAIRAYCSGNKWLEENAKAVGNW